ncbi:MAG: hypothetical protein BWY09_02404 [Candidatus Hydrogenedentes bacterium ADurb.Bin179]|nr:MAG: hypothetical protein BWY09_02404 [Candidatus Hydrogenedentes bacterium ADurb.Bin179]
MSITDTPPSWLHYARACVVRLIITSDIEIPPVLHYARACEVRGCPGVMGVSLYVRR